MGGSTLDEGAGFEVIDPAPSVPPGATDTRGPDARAARRVAEALVGLERLNVNVVVLPPPDAAFTAAMRRARDAAIVAGRRTLLESAARNAREVAMRAFSRSGFSGTWAATDMGASVVRADDRVAVAAAFEAAATAAVAEDVIDSETLEILREPTDALRRAAGLAPPGALSNITTGVTAGGEPSSVGRGSTSGPQVLIAIGVVIVGVAVGYAVGALAIGIIVIVAGLAILGAWAGAGRRASG